MPKVILTKDARIRKQAEIRSSMISMWVKRKIEERNISQTELADWLDISLVAANKKLNGGIKMSLTDLIVILEHINAEPEELEVLMVGRI